MTTFELNILSPERPFYRGKCESVIVPIQDGQLGIWANHSPVIAAIVPGELSYTIPGEGTQLVAVSEGILNVKGNVVQILVDTVERPEEIDEERLLEKINELEERSRKNSTYREYRLTQATMARAMSRMKVKKRSTDHKI